jgi:hypothetical protein
MHILLNKGLVTLCFFLAYSKLVGQYRQHFPVEFKFALNFYKDHKREFIKSSRQIRLTPNQLFSLVAPEISQYNSLKNYVESSSLKVLYVQKGKEYADFSIGFFQMKPSFVEIIENEIRLDNNLMKKYSDCLITKVEVKTQRIERLKRIESLDWQFKYLVVFSEIVHKKFGDKFSSKKEELIFYSTVFNTGVNKSPEIIKKELEKKRFPHFSLTKFNYSDVSVEFYNYLINKE